MKKLYICMLFAIIILGGIFYLAVFCNKKNDLIQVKETYSSLQVASNSYLKEINEEDEISKMLIYYPETEYEVLNENILNLIKQYGQNFKYEAKNINTEMLRKFELNINFDSYEYKDYVSYAFYISIDMLGAHPAYYISTINYDIKNNKIITIEDLASKNTNLLNVLSKYCYEILSKEDRIVEYGNLEQLKNGTEPKADNFKNIVFTKSGLMVLFEKYSIGPYVLGEFSVTVPYEKIL